jgi:hypothetical protein
MNGRAFRPWPAAVIIMYMDGLLNLLPANTAAAKRASPKILLTLKSVKDGEEWEGQMNE